MSKVYCLVSSNMIFGDDSLEIIMISKNGNFLERLKYLIKTYCSVAGELKFFDVVPYNLDMICDNKVLVYRKILELNFFGIRRETISDKLSVYSESNRLRLEKSIVKDSITDKREHKYNILEREVLNTPTIKQLDEFCENRFCISYGHLKFLVREDKNRNIVDSKNYWKYRYRGEISPYLIALQMSASFPDMCSHKKAD